MFSRSPLQTSVTSSFVVDKNSFIVRALSDRVKDWQRYASSKTCYYKK